MNDLSASSIKRVYLDVCVLCRPFDDQQQMRIRLETSAAELILTHLQVNRRQLIFSSVHQVEIAAIRNTEERQQLLLLLEQVGTAAHCNLALARQRAQELTAQGMGAADAAHVAFAEQTLADFVSVDSRLLKQCQRLKIKIWYGTPQAYCEKENLQ